MLLQSFPFSERHLHTPPQGDTATIAAAQKFITEFYTCVYRGAKDDVPHMIAPWIKYLMQILPPRTTLQATLSSSPNPALLALVQLQFLYICLTQLHFAPRCHCADKRRHCYYDHLYESLLLSRLHNIFTPTAWKPKLISTTELERLTELFFTHHAAFPDNSMLMTLVPFALQVLWWPTKSCSRKHGDVLFAMDYVQRFLEAYQQGEYAGIKKCYVRYVSNFNEQYLGKRPNRRFSAIFDTVLNPRFDHFDFRGTVFGEIGCYDRDNDPGGNLSFCDVDCRYTDWSNRKIGNFETINITGSNFSFAFVPETAVTEQREHHYQREPQYSIFRSPANLGPSSSPFTVILEPPAQERLGLKGHINPIGGLSFPPENFQITHSLYFPHHSRLIQNCIVS